MPILPYGAPADQALLLPPALPTWLPHFLLACLPTLLASLSSQLVYLARRRCPTHPLVRLAAAYAPAPVVAACAAYRHPTGPGAPPTYTIETLVRAEIVRVWAGSCSDPAL